MILKLSEIPKNLSGIYKINYNNHKIYIGYSCDIQRRMYEHQNGWKKANYRKPQDCDIAIHEQGGFTEVEILELVAPIEEQLKKREEYWTDFYDATNPQIGYNKTKFGNGTCWFGELNPNAVFTNEQVLDIRKRRFLGERKKDVYQDYLNYSFNTFEHIWLGRGYSGIGDEYLILPHSKSRQEYSAEANQGLKNGRAKCTKEEILEMRKRYDQGETISNIAKDYNFVSKSTVRRIVLREVYKNI